MVGKQFSDRASPDGPSLGSARVGLKVVDEADRTASERGGGKDRPLVVAEDLEPLGDLAGVTASAKALRRNLAVARFVGSRSGAISVPHVWHFRYDA